jgi:hypothetical protein
MTFIFVFFCCFPPTPTYVSSCFREDKLLPPVSVKALLLRVLPWLARVPMLNFDDGKEAAVCAFASVMSTLLIPQ